MVTRLKREGESVTLVLDPSLIQGIVGPGDEVTVTRAGNSIVISPVDDEQRRTRFEAAKRDTFERYDDVFRRLAE